MKIPFFYVKYENQDEFPTLEKSLACSMGKPAWDIMSVEFLENALSFVMAQNSTLVGFIFDPEFWYSHSCWERWINRLISEGTDDLINVPLGNQDPFWREGHNVSLYLTLRGIEKASKYKGPCSWEIKSSMSIHAFCVVVVPISIINKIPKNITVGELPNYWAQKNHNVRVFCEGWLHSFNAVKEASYRNDLIAMCNWKGNVLELGCGMGLMAKTCKEMGFTGVWFGMDFDKSALLKARSFLDMPLLADITKSFPFSERICFDRIVCGEVLEHLATPWELLSYLRKWIKNDGLLIASFPNVGHWSVVEDLIAGRWDETPAGILSITHFRFGTKKTWARWFETSGWEILRWEEERVPLPEGWVNCWKSNVCIDKDSLETIGYRIIARVNRRT